MNYKGVPVGIGKESLQTVLTPIREYSEGQSIV